MNDSDLQNEIAQLEKQIADLKRRLPAHSIPPAMIAELDDLEDKLEAARARKSDSGIAYPDSS